MTRTSLPELLAGFPGRRVLVLGDVMLDEYVWGEVRRISPEAPVPVVEVRRRSFVPGGAANTAANVAALGGRPVLVSVVGEDAAAATLRQLLAAGGTDPDGLCADPDRPTTTKSRVVAHNQQVARLDVEDRAPLSAALEDALLAAVARHLPRAEACVISDYAKGAVTPRVARELIRLARQAGRPVVVDPKGADYTKYRGATVVKPNLHEAERCAGAEVNGEAALAAAAGRLLGMLSGAALLVTRGAEGMSLFRPGEAPLHVPAVVRQVFDVTGAGDTVTGTLAMGLAAGGSLEAAVRLANRAASIVVGKVGTATVTCDELRAELTGLELPRAA
jgi:D-beta-D-heptose 7-phosphate kinase/D-beta-D-heptose 1-phosphate adenosyltransferase